MGGNRVELEAKNLRDTSEGRMKEKGAGLGEGVGGLVQSSDYFQRLGQGSLNEEYRSFGRNYL